MQELVGIVRNGDDMRQVAPKVAEFRERGAKASITGNRDYNPGWHTALDLENLLMVSEAIALAALARNESRGGHFREDYPDKNEQQGTVNSVISKRDGQMHVEQIPKIPVTEDQAAIIEEMK